MKANSQYEIRHRVNLDFAKFVIVCFITLLSSACAQSPAFFDDIRHTIRFETDFEALEKGFDASRKGDHAKAIEIFEELSSTSGSEEVRQKALYGLAVTRLVVAQNATQYKAAVGLWHKWSESKGIGMASGCEDPRLMEPFFLCRYPVDFDSMGFESGAHVCSDTVPKKELVAQQAKVKVLESQTANYRNKIESLRLELETLRKTKNREILALKNKIKALEAIDQNIQKKKTKVSAPQ